MRCILVLLLVAATLMAPFVPESVGAQQTLRPTLYGRVSVFQAGARTPPPLPNVLIQLFELDARAKQFALASQEPAARGLTDVNGLYGLLIPAQTAAVYRLTVSRNGNIGTGTIVRVTPGDAAVRVPDLAVDWNDRCRGYYGTGYATDYIRTKINIPWRANSEDWLTIAPKVRWTTTATPAANMIAVFPRSPGAQFGHVAWVESVDSAHRTLTVSQWNQPDGAGSTDECSRTGHFGKWSTSTWRLGDRAISGFVRPAER